MGYINKKSTGFREKSHLNFMGGPSYDLTNPILRLRIVASSCFFGEPQYYRKDPSDSRKTKVVRTPNRANLSSTQIKHLRDTLNAVDPQEWRGMTPAELMESAIDAALDHDPKRTLQLAAYLRQNENIRTTPQVILVRAAHHPKVKGTGLVRTMGAQIIRRGDEPAVGLAYQLGRYGRKAIPNSLKKAWKAALESLDDYRLAKYRMEGRQVKTLDVVNLVRANSPSIDKLMKGNLTTSGTTWEAIVSAKGSSQAAWEESVGKMGHMALLRNIRNLLKNKVSPDKFVQKLVETAEYGKQLPFRYYAAYKANDGAPPKVTDAIEECLTRSIGNLPQFAGRVMSLCDNSGSAWGALSSSAGTMPVASIGNLTGVLTGMASEEGYVGIFGDRLTRIPVRKKSSIFDTLKDCDRAGQSVGPNTENGIWLFWDQAIKNREHWDHVFVYSDMQAGHGGLYGLRPADYRDYRWGGASYIDVPKLIAHYRQKVNPKVMVYLVQTAGYQDTIIPEFFDRTFIIGGWSDSVIRFAGAMNGIWNDPENVFMAGIEPKQAQASQ